MVGLPNYWQKSNHKTVNMIIAAPFTLHMRVTEKHTISLESVRTREEGENGREERLGIRGGLSEVDFLSRQRYLENSGYRIRCEYLAIMRGKVRDIITYQTSRCSQSYTECCSSANRTQDFQFS